MLYLVGETIDKDRAYYGTERGTLVQIMRGIYVSAEADVDAVLFDHAVRIAQYLYPNTYLTGVSAESLAPTIDGRLFICGRRAQRSRLRSLEIVQTRAPDTPDLEDASLTDPIGSLTVKRSTPAFRFLETFRSRTEAGAAFPPNLKTELANRLADEAGSVDPVITRLWRLAEINGWRREAADAERYLRTPYKRAPRADFELHVGWHNAEIGQLTHDGTRWHWRAADNVAPNPVRPGLPGTLPTMIESLLPEGWLDKVINAKSDRERLVSGKRYTSNIVVSQDPEDLRALPPDRLQGKLADYIEDGRFTGVYHGPAPQGAERSFEEVNAALFANSQIPRLSGVQIKTPLTLSSDGTLKPAENGPFTHILKPSPGAGFEALPVIEHACLAAARSCGFATPVHALTAIPGDLPDALIVERFDIRQSEDDERRLAVEDMASVRGIPSSEKYEGSIEQVARAMRPISTDPEDDVRLLVRRVVFAWLIADGDMHLKNMALLKIANRNEDRFSSVRLAPVYDVVTTRIFPGLENDNMALTVNGKRNRIKKSDVVRSGVTMGLAASDCDRQIDIIKLRLDAHLREFKTDNLSLKRATSIWRERTEAL